jgi:hypothetical protein
MTEQPSKETKSFHDPMARRLAAAEAHQQRLETQYPAVNAVYDGFYHQFEPTEDTGVAYFAGGESIVGSQLKVVIDNECFCGDSDSSVDVNNDGGGDGNGGSSNGSSVDSNHSQNHTVWLIATDGRRLSKIVGDKGLRLARLAAKGWTIKAYIDVLYFRSEDKVVIAEVAFICWDSSELLNQAMETFCKHIADRIAHGDHANLALTQENLIQVIDSKGSWFLTGSTPYPIREKGTVTYKSHRTGSESLVGYALAHNKGCGIVANIFWVVLALVIIGLVWRFVFN